MVQSSRRQHKTIGKGMRRRGDKTRRDEKIREGRRGAMTPEEIRRDETRRGVSKNYHTLEIRRHDRRKIETRRHERQTDIQTDRITGWLTEWLKKISRVVVVVGGGEVESNEKVEIMQNLWQHVKHAKLHPAQPQAWKEWILDSSGLSAKGILICACTRTTES